MHSLKERGPKKRQIGWLHNSLIEWHHANHQNHLGFDIGPTKNAFWGKQIYDLKLSIST